jgi:hypothetical protein
VTFYTKASVTITMPNIAGQSQRKVSQLYILQMVSRKIMPVLKEVLVDRTLGRSTLHIWLFIAEVKDEFILGLNIQ